VSAASSHSDATPRTTHKKTDRSEGLRRRALGTGVELEVTPQDNFRRRLAEAIPGQNHQGGAIKYNPFEPKNALASRRNANGRIVASHGETDERSMSSQE
jgi:hypothetical protein